MIDFDGTAAAAVIAAFAEQITVRQHRTGLTAPGRGIFQQGARVQVMGDDDRMHWTTRAPSICIRSNDFPFVPDRNDLITRADGAAYVVVDRQQDGVAMVNLTLKDAG